MTTTLNASTSSGFVMTPDNSGTIGLQGNGTTGLTVDTSGYVLTPTRPSFRAKCTSNSNITTSPVPFNATDFNVGGCYSTSTYRFTAPVTGIYFFSAKVYVQPGSATYSNAGLYKNGNLFAYVEFGNNTAQLTLSISEAMNLTVGDYVTVSFSSNGKQ